MLAARCVHLVCDAPDSCGVDELLVVTFTEAAASEMKSRIHAALRERAAQSPSTRLDRQLALVNHASVSTLHSFCAKLLREHFHAVGLDPGFVVLDGDEAGLLRRETARDLFDHCYEFDEHGDFHRFIDAYGEGDDQRLMGLVVQTHEMLESLVDPLGWIDRARQRIAGAAEGELADSDLGVELTEILSRTIAATRAQCDRATNLIQSLGSFPAYLTELTNCSRSLRYWDELLGSEGIDALGEHVRSHPRDRLPSVSNSLPGKEQAKQAVDAVRDAMTRGALFELLRFTTAQWQEGLAGIQPHSEMFLQLVERFGRRYRDVKNASRVLDFADLERFAFKVLCDTSAGATLTPSRAARGYHKRFAHVLVDEYQDINELQDAILTLLSRECICDEPGQTGNFFCVGDVKQSIYRFRLAETGRFLERQRTYRGDGTSSRGIVIDLQSNFRSRSALLEAVNEVFERLMTADAADIDYDQTHRLHPGLPYPTSGPPSFSGAPLEMHLLPANLQSDEAASESETPSADAEEADLDRSQREAVLIASRIRKLTGLDGSPPMQITEPDGIGSFQTRPVQFKDIVILLRSMRYKSEQFADVLRRADIPVHAQSGTGYFESMEIRDMLSLLAILENQRQDIPLAAVLRGPLANLPEPDNCLTHIRLAYPTEPPEVAIPFHDAVVQYANEQDDEVAAALRDFLARLKSWRAMAHSRPLAEVIGHIYDQTGYLAFCAALHDGQQRVANLSDFRQRAAQFGSFRRQGLSRFLAFLESLRDEVDLGQPSTASEADNVVRIMSIHRSKGLEFPIVVLPDLGKKINLSDCHGAIIADRAAGLGMAVVDEHRMIRYPSLAQLLVRRRLRQQALAEELRVLYVAMTRAKEHLILVGTCDPKSTETWDRRWGGYTGPFSADDILRARCMLDWLGPVSAAAGPGMIKVETHSAPEVSSWQAEHKTRPDFSPAQMQLAALTPLPETPAPDPIATRIIARLDHVYPFEAFTRVQAAQAVTAIAKKTDRSAAQPVDLPVPRFGADQTPSPTTIGDVTHRVMLHLDFSRACDAKDLEQQISEMVDRKLIAPSAAKLVRHDDIHWLLSTEVGSLLKVNAKELLRELPIHFAVSSSEASSDDPLDQIMVRGRIDLLAPTPHGTVLIDYKTDNVSANGVPARAASYLPQLNAYSTAVQKITGQPPAATYLVFLTARVIHKV
ncbi:MAG TPA: helicase-exonuclease AddAB subunit AddA [Tepidisphaeraceae bacterium]